MQGLKRTWGLQKLKLKLEKWKNYEMQEKVRNIKELTFLEMWK